MKCKRNRRVKREDIKEDLAFELLHSVIKNLSTNLGPLNLAFE